MRKKLIFLLVNLICLLYLSSCSKDNDGFRSSEIFDSFPIPMEAKLMNSDKNSEQYNYSNVTEEDGLPTIYRTEIETHNWREVDRLGAKYVFEKYEQKVSLFIFTGKIELRKIQEYK